MSGHLWHFYDESERQRWQNPEAILAEIGVEPGQTFIDLGCGQGFFTIPAAHRVGTHGLVYALDSSSESLAILSSKAEKAGLSNIQIKVAEAEDGPICLACADWVFMGIVLHDFHDPSKVLRNARTMLKPGGHLADLDWKKAPMKIGPPLEKRFDISKAESILSSSGFLIEKSGDYGTYDYLIVAR
jgi:ubiquinone/menaquinone biosynthesis C-methylase UbiE